jgi:hypothetical protein
MVFFYQENTKKKISYLKFCLQIPKVGLLFNHICTYPVPIKTLKVRYEMVKHLLKMLTVGLITASFLSCSSAFSDMTEKLQPSYKARSVDTSQKVSGLILSPEES